MPIQRQNKNKLNTEKLRSLSGQILQLANKGMTRTYFLRSVLKIISDFFKADEINVLLKVFTDVNRNELIQFNQKSFKYGFYPPTNNTESQNNESTELEEYWKLILNGNLDDSLSFVTQKGSLHIQDFNSHRSDKEILKRLSILDNLTKKDIKSILVTPFLREDECIGLMEFRSCNKEFLSDYNINSIETFIHTLGMTFLNQHTQAALQERVKELTCLYSMSQIADKPYFSLEDLVYNVMDLVPPAWQYPDITQSRIILDGIDYSFPDFNPDAKKLSVDICVGATVRGKIEVIYTKERPQLDEGPFLKEERSLLEVIAKELAQIIKRRESEEDKEKLINQLHHADRLATVGELAAGVAHEINEPLGSILGFAQLAIKNKEVPDQVRNDLEKIVSASLHAREIVKKLMNFSRQITFEKKMINLNQIIEESIYFFKSRCLKEGIELNISLDSEMPEIFADPVQINQVLVNIVVNAMQSMPNGGKLSIQSSFSDDNIELVIADTGYGMKEDILQQIFEPFFTTKKSSNGLGLGLSVVDAIIKSHNGKIETQSEPGVGTEFVIKLPHGESKEITTGE
jgi:signal transduction histidine kinase